MLEYDNNAFYYFALTFLFLYAIPGTWYILSELYEAYIKKPTVDIKSRTKVEALKAQKLKKELYGYARINNLTFKINLGLVVFVWLAITVIIFFVMRDGKVSSFDPYDILEIEKGASISVIKKAYRRLSLLYHPDKNPGDADKADIFMRIAKAYQALTDPVSRENFEKYGNPDGKQALEVSIGLPTFLLENPKVVLVLYLCGMIFFIPAAVGIWYANSQQYGEKNILYETYSTFYQLLSAEHNQVGMIPEILAASAECRQIVQLDQGLPSGTDVKAATAGGASSSSTPSDDIAIGRLYGSKLSKLMIKPRLENKLILRSNILIHAHIARLTADLPASAGKLMDRLLLKIPSLIEGLVEIAQQRRWNSVAVAIIHFQQNLIQALHWNGHPLITPFLQLPHLTEADVKSLLAKPEDPNATRITKLSDFLNISESEKRAMLTKCGSLEPSQIDEIIAATVELSNLKVETKVYVEDEGEESDINFYRDNMDDETKKLIELKNSPDYVPPKKRNNSKKGGKKSNANVSSLLAPGSTVAAPVKKLAIEDIRGHDVFEGDLVTIKVVINRPDAAGNTDGNVNSVYAPYFPGVVKEILWVVLSEQPPKPPPGTPQRGKMPEPTVHAMERLPSQARSIVKELKFMAPPKAGTYSMQLQVFSDSYIGMDVNQQITFTVRPADELPEHEWNEVSGQVYMCICV